MFNKINYRGLGEHAFSSPGNTVLLRSLISWVQSSINDVEALQNFSGLFETALSEYKENAIICDLVNGLVSLEAPQKMPIQLLSISAMQRDKAIGTYIKATKLSEEQAALLGRIKDWNRLGVDKYYPTLLFGWAFLNEGDLLEKSVKHFCDGKEWLTKHNVDKDTPLLLAAWKGAKDATEYILKEIGEDADLFTRCSIGEGGDSAHTWACKAEPYKSQTIQTFHKDTAEQLLLHMAKLQVCTNGDIMRHQRAFKSSKCFYKDVLELCSQDPDYKGIPIDGKRSASELLELGIDARDIVNSKSIIDAHAAFSLYQNEISINDLRAAGATVAALAQSEIPVTSLLASNITITELLGAGYSARELKDAGMNLSDLIAVNVDGLDLLKAGYSIDAVMGRAQVAQINFDSADPALRNQIFDFKKQQHDKILELIKSKKASKQKATSSRTNPILVDGRTQAGKSLSLDVAIGKYWNLFGLRKEASGKKSHTGTQRRIITAYAGLMGKKTCDKLVSQLTPASAVATSIFVPAADRVAGREAEAAAAAEQDPPTA